MGFPLLRNMTIGFCWPYKGEFDRALPDPCTLRPHGARAALPEVVARDAPLVFREWWPGVAMTPRVFDLPVPDDTNVVQPHALLIPPVGFDAQRLPARLRRRLLRSHAGRAARCSR
jgi:5-formyltetrahydrofolate cyclo-ligase